MPIVALARRAHSAVKTVSSLGLRRTALRLRHELSQRSGWLARRYPAGALEQWRPSPAVLERLRDGIERGLFCAVDRSTLRNDYRRIFPAIGPRLLVDADRLVSGEMQYFSRHWARFDPQSDWFRNPFTGQMVDESSHWTHVAWDSPASGDLKFQLDPARFAWVYLLARAYWYTGDEQYSAAFWQLFDGWCRQNPPQAGPLWICGQESSLRLMAMVFGLYFFAHSAATTDERLGRLAAMVAAHADRVLGTTAYARSQQNNHALSEGTGLLTAGLVLVGYPAAEQWWKKGKAILEEQVPLQIYDDGGYTQHSHNYHRVMLQVLTWAVCISEHFGRPLSEQVAARLGLAANFLCQMLDPESGQAPNYGPNDGALVLPLSACPYEDFRPAVQAAGWAAGHKLDLGVGEWNEALFWLAGTRVAERAQQSTCPESPRIAAAATPSHTAFPTAGYDVLRGRESWAMIRAAHYRDRPNEADQLHLDVWWQGINVACDAGTFLYNGPPPWRNALASTCVHNTVNVDGQDQMTRAGRFLWLDWAQAERTVRESPNRNLTLWRGSHQGYRRLDAQLDHVREVLRLGDAHWLVFDSLFGRTAHQFRLHWLLPDYPHRWDNAAGRLLLDTPAGAFEVLTGSMSETSEATLVVGDPNSTRGWRSRYYGDRQPAISLAREIKSSQARFWTLLGPPGLTTAIDDQSFCLNATKWLARIDLNAPSARTRIGLVSWEGVTPDTLQATNED